MKTPDTDALIAADLHHLDDDETCPASAYWRMANHAREMESKRDDFFLTAACMASDLAALRNAVRNMRDVKGRHHTQQATEELLALLPENQ